MGGNTLTPLVVSVSAPESHGEQPPDAGEDTTAPVVTITPVDTLGATASFTITAVDASTVTFECMLTTNTVAGSWESCTSPTTFTDLAAGDYVFSVRGTDKGGLVSDVVTKSWTVDLTPPIVTVEPVDTLGTTASFTLVAVDESDVTLECLLTTNGTAGQWESCTSPKTYSGLQPGTYGFSARATDTADNVSDLVTREWVVAATTTTPTTTPTPTPTPTPTSTTPVTTVVTPPLVVVAPLLLKNDFNGDGHADVLARDAQGGLWLYPGNGTGGWLAKVKVGTGWSSMTALVAPGDFNGDRHADLLARDAQGNLWLYPGNGKGGWLAKVKVGTGWGSMTALVGIGAFNRDLNPDLLARDAQGNLWLYPGNGTGRWLPKVKVGSGWGGMTALVGVGDFNGDRHPDLFARDAQGNLWLYSGNGTGSWLAKAKVSTGWNGMTALVGPGDFSGDGRVDLIARDSVGRLQLHRGNGVAGWILPSRQIGIGWNGMTAIVS